MKLKHLLEGQFDERNSEEAEIEDEKYRAALSEKRSVLMAWYIEKGGISDHLYDALDRRGFKVFDHEPIPSGYVVNPENIIIGLASYVFEDTPENWKLINKLYKVKKETYLLWKRIKVIRRRLGEIR